MTLMERRKKERAVKWEVVDVELAHVFLCETKDGRDAFVNAVELMGHRAIVKEIQL